MARNERGGRGVARDLWASRVLLFSWGLRGAERMENLSWFWQWDHSRIAIATTRPTFDRPPPPHPEYTLLRGGRHKGGAYQISAARRFKICSVWPEIGRKGCTIFLPPWCNFDCDPVHLLPGNQPAAHHLLQLQSCKRAHSWCPLDRRPWRDRRPPYLGITWPCVATPVTLYRAPNWKTGKMTFLGSRNSSLASPSWSHLNGCLGVCTSPQ